MHLAYVDETYDAALYSFAALLVDADRDAAMQREVLAIPGRLAGDGVDPEAELHGSDLFHARRAWEVLRDRPDLRVHAYRLALRSIASCDGKVVLVSIARTGAAADDLGIAREQAMACLLTCLERECEQLGDRCMLILDEVGSMDRAVVDAVHSHHRRELIGGAEPRIVEAPAIVRSHATPGVQVTDLVAFLFQRRRSGRDDPDSAAGQANEALWRILEPSVICAIDPQTHRSRLAAASTLLREPVGHSQPQL